MKKLLWAIWYFLIYAPVVTIFMPDKAKEVQPKVCRRCEKEFEPVYRGKDIFSVRCDECERFIVAQTMEARETDRVTTRSGGSIPVWIAYRCLYCGEYFNQSEAEEHFGETRLAYSNS